VVRTHSVWLARVAVPAAAAALLAGAVAAPAAGRGTNNNPSATTSCATLSPGATGAAVKTIQKLVGTATDGAFGPATQKALKHWQKKHGVAVTGVVDTATWAALPPKVGRTACGRHVSGSGAAATCAVLGNGASGLAVVVLQRALGVSADGQFGPVTGRAVKKLQRDRELHVTGTSTAKTWKALKRFGTPACSTAATTGSQPKDAKAQAKVRARVQRLVAALEQKTGASKNKLARQAMAWGRKQIGKPYVYGGTGPKGFDCSGLQMKAYQHAGLTIPRVAAAQYSGAGTAERLDRAKQGDLLFYASDVTKPATVYHEAMYVGAGNMLEAPHTGETVHVSPLRSTDLLPLVVRPAAALSLPLKSGDTGWSVTQLQQALNRHHAGLTVDGGFGAATRKAVRAWQQKKGLKVTGVVRMATWLTLG
jgi:cell wall-associated NlpC family hydrolase